MSIYSKFQARIDAAENTKRPGTREASLVLVENAGGDPLLGIQYQCDFRSEEESGAGKISELFTRASDPSGFFAQEYLLQDGNKGLLPNLTQADLIVETDELIGFRADTRFSSFEHEASLALNYIREAAAWADGRSKLRRRYWHLTVAELKAEAKSRGLKGYSKLRAKELEQFLADDDFAKLHADGVPESLSQPGWFHYGGVLFFEKKNGLFGDVLKELVEAAKAGFLVMGSGGIGFGSGFNLFDARDLTEQATAEISASNRWYKEQMELLKPVAEVVEQGPMASRSNYGRAYFFLGKPTQFDGTDEVKYWLNGNSVRFPNGRSEQPFGYYTLQELLDEKYMEDAAAKSDANFKRYTPEGKNRKVEFTDEQAEEELRARNLRWASKPMGGN